MLNKTLINAMNQYLANLTVMYVKLHNLHWNVVGPDFKQVHEYLESMYDDTADNLDEAAELLKIHGAQPLASMEDCLATASIQELPSEEVRSGAALAIVQSDLMALLDQCEAIRAEADEAHLSDIVSFAEDQIASFNKTLWFIRAMLK